LLVEGPGDVFRVLEAGHAAVALLGTELTDAQTDKLALLDRTVLVALDNDAAGLAARRKVCDELVRRGVRAQPWPVPGAYKDVGEMPVGEVRRWMGGYARKEIVAAG
jgi:DNA primase